MFFWVFVIVTWTFVWTFIPALYFPSSWRRRDLLGLHPTPNAGVLLSFGGGGAFVLSNGLMVYGLPLPVVCFWLFFFYGSLTDDPRSPVRLHAVFALGIATRFPLLYFLQLLDFFPGFFLPRGSLFFRPSILTDVIAPYSRDFSGVSFFTPRARPLVNPMEDSLCLLWLFFFPIRENWEQFLLFWV